MIDFYPIDVIELERVNLRMIEEKDAKGIYAIRNNQEMIRYTGIPQMQTMDEANTFVSTRVEGMKANKWIYLIVTNKEDDSLMGTICLFNFNVGNKSADIGYELLPRFQGNGYMHEAVLGLMTFAFESLKLENITADIYKENRASINLIKKAGFKFSKDLDGGYALFSASSS